MMLDVGADYLFLLYASLTIMILMNNVVDKISENNNKCMKIWIL